MIKRDKPSLTAIIIATIFGALFILVMFVASPLLALLIGMVIGYILEIFTEDYVVQAFNVIGLDRVKDGDLPKVFGLLGVLVAMIKVGTSTAKSKDATGEKGTK